MKQIKQFYLLAFFFSLNSYSQICNIGNQTTTPSFISGSFGANFLLGVKYNLSQDGTLRSINLLGNNTGEGVQMAVYNDVAGIPNNLIASSNLGTVGSGVTSLPVAPILLPAGDYWIMAVYQVGGNSSNYNPTAANTVYYKSLTYGSPIPINASGFNTYTGQDFLYFLGIDCGNTLSTDSFDLVKNITLYPNPTSDFISISNLEFRENYVIVNQLAQIVLKGNTDNGEKIDVKSLTNGFYFLKMNNGNTIKFIKN